MGPLGPHLDQFLQPCFDGFGGVFDVGVPDLVGSQPGHLQIVVLYDVYCHYTLVVGIGLVIAPGVVHVALDDVQNLANEYYGCVSLLPVVFEDSIAERLQQKVSVAETIVVNQHFFH